MHKTGLGKREILPRDEGKYEPVDSKKFYRICNGNSRNERSCRRRTENEKE
jgi:hypothetical protein